MTSMTNLSAPKDDFWVAVDWGTSSLRIWKMAFEGHVLESLRSEKGMNTLKSDEYEGVLLSLIEPWLPEDHRVISVLICGMAGSKQGWKEAPYVPLPAELSQLYRNLQYVKTVSNRIRVHIVPGLCQQEAGHPDVVRGEETQLLGLSQEIGIEDGLVCLPGTHSKWIEVSNGRAVKSRTFLTGEIHSLLASQSILRHSVSHSEQVDLSSFLKGVEAIASNNIGLLEALFSIRANHILNGSQGTENASFLSGLLIGCELKEALGQADSVKHQTIHIVGSDQLAELYGIAFPVFGKTAENHRSDKAVVHGLTAIHREMRAHAYQ